MQQRRSLNGFDILDRLGSGSFGTVFKVRKKSTGKMYVMKQIETSNMTDAERSSAEKEIRVLAFVRSAYVVRLYDSFHARAKLCLIMEWCRKGDLQQFLRKRKRPLKEEKAVRIAAQIAAGLRAIHAMRVIHRDVKTANCFICLDGRIKIGDLGVARVLGSKSSMAKTMVGTPYYFSPELCENKPYGAKSDIWALGCILYECCTLKHPFTARNQGALVYKIVSGKYEPVSKDAFSIDLVRLADALLSRDPRKRPTADDVLRLDVVTKWIDLCDEIDDPKSQRTMATRRSNEGGRQRAADDRTSLDRRRPPPRGGRSKEKTRIRERVKFGRRGKAMKMRREIETRDTRRVQHLRRAVERQKLRDERQPSSSSSSPVDPDDVTTDRDDTFEFSILQETISGGTAAEDEPNEVGSDDTDAIEYSIHREAPCAWLESEETSEESDDSEQDREESQGQLDDETTLALDTSLASVDDFEIATVLEHEEGEDEDVVDDGRTALSDSRLDRDDVDDVELRVELLNDRARRLTGLLDACRKTCIALHDDDETRAQETYEMLSRNERTPRELTETYLRRDRSLSFSAAMSQVHSVLMVLSYERAVERTTQEMEAIFGT